MDEQTRRQILIDVAEGRLSPEEAAERLDGGDEEEPPHAAPSGSDGPVRRVRIVVPFGTTRVTGESSVLEAVADGPHLARREGEVLIIEGERIDGDGYSFGRDRGRHHRRAMGMRSRPLSVRMHPDLPLEIELAAGTLSVRGIRSEIRAEVSAGAARIEDVASPIDVSVASGSLRVSGVLDRGESRVRCEAGAVRVHLEKGSSVNITVRAGVGKVHLPGERHERQERGPMAWLLGGGSRTATVGAGVGTLDVDASIGTVHVSAD